MTFLSGVVYNNGLSFWALSEYWRNFRWLIEAWAHAGQLAKIGIDF